jgi:fructose-bisphosphate aldolase, class I
VIVRSMGKQLRMRRVFKNGRALVLPLDHPIYFGPQNGSETPAKLLALARDHGATAVLLTAGALRSAVDEVGDLGIIMRIDATLSQIGGPDTIMHLLHSAEEAAALGADMVVLNCYLGLGDAQIESSLLTKLATVSAECERIGMPLCGEIIPRVSYKDPAQTMPTSADLATAIRFGLEYGCDVVKTVYNGDPEGYAKAVAAGHLPVIMAGGPKTGDGQRRRHRPPRLGKRPPRRNAGRHPRHRPRGHLRGRGHKTLHSVGFMMTAPRVRDAPP